MTLDKLIERLQTIKAEHPEHGNTHIVVKSCRFVPDKRKRDGMRYETSHHYLKFACSTPVHGLFDRRELVIELIADAYLGWR